MLQDNDRRVEIIGTYAGVGGDTDSDDHLGLITVVGQGYVGLTTALILARAGYDVVGVEYAPDRLARLEELQIPFRAPGLAHELASDYAARHISFTSELRRSSVFVVAVPAPTTSSGEVDLSAVDDVIAKINGASWSPALIIIRTTLPPGSCVSIQRRWGSSGAQFAYWPEFLNQHTAFKDMSSPDRLVLGVDTREARGLVEGILFRIYKGRFPTYWMSTAEAEAVKLFSNSMLAANKILGAEVAKYCAAMGIDSISVLAAMSADLRLSSDLLRPAPGLVDSCLRKDLRALAKAGVVSSDGRIFDSLLNVELDHRRAAVDIVCAHLKSSEEPARVLVIGTGFEPYVSDTGESLMPDIVDAIGEEGVVRVWDPAAVTSNLPSGLLTSDILEELRASEIVIALVDYPEIGAVDWAEWLRGEARRPRLVFDFCGSAVLHEISQLSGYHAWGAAARCDLCAA